ncbi:unnamed protein product, partial [Allacma fusca]
MYGVPQMIQSLKTFSTR